MIDGALSAKAENIYIKMGSTFIYGVTIGGKSLPTNITLVWLIAINSISCHGIGWILELELFIF